MSARVKVPFLAIVLVAAGVGCDALTPTPGRGFGVTVLDPFPLDAIGRINVPVRVSVAGCDAFDATVRNDAGASHSVIFEPQPDGTFVASVPVEWLRGEDGFCLHDAQFSLWSLAAVVVTCRDASREALAYFSVEYGAATHAYDNSGWRNALPESAFASANPLQPYVLSPLPLEPDAVLTPARMTVRQFLDPAVLRRTSLARPRLASNASSVFWSAWCDPSWPDYLSCPMIDLAPSVSVRSDAIFGQSQDPVSLLPTFPGWGPIWVPANVVDMAFVDDGTLVVLSDFELCAQSCVSMTAVTTVVPSPDGTAEVRSIAHFPDEGVATRFSRTADGRLAFVDYVFRDHFGPNTTSVLHTTDGVTVESRATPTGAAALWQEYGVGGGFQLACIFLSPDAESVVVSGGTLGSTDGTGQSITTDWVCRAASDADGAAWPTGAVALWRGSSMWLGEAGVGDRGRVEVFDATPPHPLIYAYDV